MNQVVRINSTDQHIAYSGTWNVGFNSTLFSYTTTSSIFLLFRGTSIKLYGNTREVIGGALRFTLDGDVKTITLNDTTFQDGTTPMYRADNMKDGDHQFSCDLIQPTNGSAEIDYFEIETSSGGAFDLLSVGPTALDVPANAIIVDNISPDIIYHNTSNWSHINDRITVYERTLSYTVYKGSSVSYSFDGVAIWYYGSVGPSYGAFTVAIDGSTPERLNASASLNVDQRMLWSNTSLGTGRHTVTLTHDDSYTASLSLDFFRVLPQEGSSTFSTTSLGELPTIAPLVSPTNHDQPNIIPLAVGLALGLLALLVGILGVRYLYHRSRKRRMLIHLDAHVPLPYTVSPTRQAAGQSSHHQLSLPQNGKGPPEPARPLGAPMAASVTATSLSGTELEPPPSYDSPVHTWRAGVTK